MPSFPSAPKRPHEIIQHGTVKWEKSLLSCINALFRSSLGPKTTTTGFWFRVAVSHCIKYSLFLAIFSQNSSDHPRSNLVIPSLCKRDLKSSDIIISHSNWGMSKVEKLILSKVSITTTLSQSNINLLNHDFSHILNLWPLYSFFGIVSSFPIVRTDLKVSI